MIDIGQTQRSLISILNLMVQSEKLCQSQGAFWIKSQKITMHDGNITLHVVRML